MRKFSFFLNIALLLSVIALGLIRVYKHYDQPKTVAVMGQEADQLAIVRWSNPKTGVTSYSFPMKHSKALQIYDRKKENIFSSPKPGEEKVTIFLYGSEEFKNAMRELKDRDPRSFPFPTPPRSQ